METPQKLNLVEIEKYLTSETDPLEMATVLDEIEHEYTQLAVSSQCGPDKGLALRLFYLRKLRNIMFRMGGINVRN